jgi:hypothetical protein
LTDAKLPPDLGGSFFSGSFIPPQIKTDCPVGSPFLFS